MFHGSAHHLLFYKSSGYKGVDIREKALLLIITSKLIHILPLDVNFNHFNFFLIFFQLFFHFLFFFYIFILI
jgi:hypothetical protein